MRSKQYLIVLVSVLAPVLLAGCIHMTGVSPKPVQLSGQIIPLTPEDMPDEVLIFNSVSDRHVRLTDTSFYTLDENEFLAGRAKVQPDGSWEFSGELCPNIHIFMGGDVLTVDGLNVRSSKQVVVDRIMKYTWKINADYQISQNGSTVSNLILTQISPGPTLGWIAEEYLRRPEKSARNRCAE